MLGSAQVRVTRPDGHRVVYTGDLSLGPTLTATETVVAECDTLVIESTFGHPRYRFPERERTYDEVAAWAGSGSSPTSSRKSVPPSARSKRPARVAWAPV